jgi:hypothetical protein
MTPPIATALLVDNIAGLTEISPFVADTEF